MALLGSTSSVRLASRATVDRSFNLRTFSSLDPGTGPTEVSGTIEGRRLDLVIRSGLAAHLRPEAFIESDAPEIVAEAAKAWRRLRPTPPPGARRLLVRYVNAMLEKKPTMSLPSARRSPAHPGRRLQRAHRAVRGAWRAPWGSRRASTSASSTARRVLLPRVARGVSSTRATARARAVDARRSDPQPVSRRRDPCPAGAGRPRSPGRDPPASSVAARITVLERRAAPGGHVPASRRRADGSTAAPSTSPATPGRQLRRRSARALGGLARIL